MPDLENANSEALVKLGERASPRTGDSRILRHLAGSNRMEPETLQPERPDPQCWQAARSMSAAPRRRTFRPDALAAAAAYSARYRGVALLVACDGEIVFEDYPNGGAPDRANPIASGTKSFTGALAVAAAADGLLTFDELAVGTLPEWRDDPLKSKITLRHLLQFVSGLDGGKPGRSPDFASSLGTPATHSPGERFLYGSAPFQVFGEVLRRKLAGQFADPLTYLEARVFAPIGLTVSGWRRGTDGLPQLASGAALTLREWWKFGELIRAAGRWHGQPVLPADLLDESLRGSAVNPCYGMGWWRNEVPTDTLRGLQRVWTLGLEDLSDAPHVPRDLVYAAGAAKQRLYVSPSLGIVVVRQAEGILEALANGDRGGFSDGEFLRRLLETAG